LWEQGPWTRPKIQELEGLKVRYSGTLWGDLRVREHQFMRGVIDLAAQSQKGRPLCPCFHHEVCPLGGLKGQGGSTGGVFAKSTDIECYASIIGRSAGTSVHNQYREGHILFAWVASCQPSEVMHRGLERQSLRRFGKVFDRLCTLDSWCEGSILTCVQQP
jgi:hypothetical protein